MGGPESEMFLYFKGLLIKGMYELRLHVESLIMLIETMSKSSNFLCFSAGESEIKALRDRFHCCYSEEQCMAKVENMIYYSMGNWRTSYYDDCHRFFNNVYT